MNTTTHLYKLILTRTIDNLTHTHDIIYKTKGEADKAAIEFLYGSANKVVQTTVFVKPLKILSQKIQSKG